MNCNIQSVKKGVNGLEIGAALCTVISRPKMWVSRTRRGGMPEAATPSNPHDGSTSRHYWFKARRILKIQAAHLSLAISAVGIEHSIFAEKVAFVVR